MGRERRGGYIFDTQVADHPPRHVHVYKDGHLVVKCNLDDWLPMKVKENARILKHLKELIAEGKI